MDDVDVDSGVEVDDVAAEVLLEVDDCVLVIELVSVLLELVMEDVERVDVAIALAVAGGMRVVLVLIDGVLEAVTSTVDFAVLLTVLVVVSPSPNASLSKLLRKSLAGWTFNWFGNALTALTRTRRIANLMIRG